MSEAYKGLSRQVQGYLARNGVSPCEQFLAMWETSAIDRSSTDAGSILRLVIAYAQLNTKHERYQTVQGRAIFVTRDTYSPPSPEETFEKLSQTIANARINKST